MKSVKRWGVAKLPLTILLLLMSVTMTMAQSGSIKGVVYDGSGTVPGCKVALNDSIISLVTRSDVQGRFVLKGIPTGVTELVFSSIGFEDLIVAIEVKDDEIVDLGNVYLNEEAQQFGEVVVTTRIPGEMRAINMKKNSGNVVEIISADGIGKLPDRNAAEAVQRASGVSIEKDQGEGRFVSVRGLPAEWSSATMNGNRIPTAGDEGVSRSAQFDFFPTDMIQMAVISKTFTPDMESDAMGGSVNFITRTAPVDSVLDISLGGGLNHKSGGPIYSGNILYGDRSKNNKFGYLLNATYWQRDWATDNFEPRRGGRDGTAIKRLELRDYAGTRKTTGFNGAMEYNFNAKNKIYAKGMYGSLLDQELHYKHRLRFDKDRIEQQNIYNDLITTFFSGEIGGEHTLNIKNTFTWQVSSNLNEFKYGNVPNKDNNSYWVVRFDQNNVGYTGLTQDPDGEFYSNNLVDGGVSNPLNPNTQLGNNFRFNPSQAQFSNAQMYRVYVKERDYIVGQMDLESQLSARVSLKFGAKFRGKERVAEYEDLFYYWNGTGPAPYLSDFQLTEQPGRDEYLSEIGGLQQNIFTEVLTQDELLNFWSNNQDNLFLDSTASATIENGGAIGRNFVVNETHSSAYAMGRFQLTDKVQLMIGARNTFTTVKVDGYEYDEGTGVTSEVTKTNSYNSLLPMFSAKITPTKLTNVHLSVARTFSRPSFGAIAPGGAFSEADLIYEAGNTNLRPIYSWNFDATVEHYFGNVGQVTMGYFFKHITDPIFETRKRENYNGVDNVLITRPENGSDAWLGGMEFGIIRKLDFLPGFLSGLGVNANYTFMHSEMSIPDREEKVRIPRQASHIYNVALFYERGNAQLRVALNHKGAYVMQHGSESSSDEYFDGYTSMDFTASYNITPKILVYAEMNNVLNNPMKYYLGTPDRPTQVEYYGVRGQVGLKWSLF